MLDEHVPFLEGAFVEQQLDALARGELALAVLRGDAFLAAAEARLARLARLSCWMMSCMAGASSGIGFWNRFRRARRGRGRDARPSTSAPFAATRRAHRGMPVEGVAQAGVDACPTSRPCLPTGAAAAARSRHRRASRRLEVAATAAQNVGDALRQRLICITCGVPAVPACAGLPWKRKTRSAEDLRLGARRRHSGRCRPC